MTPEQQNALDSMPHRERECLRLLGQRLTSKEAARLLDIQPSTVRTNLRRSTDRLKVASARDAAVLLAAHEADDPVVSEWLHRLLTTVSAAAVVIDRARVSPEPIPEHLPASELDAGRPAPRAPASDAGERSGDGRPSPGGSGRDAAHADVAGSALRAPDDPDSRGADLTPQVGLPAGAALVERSPAHAVTLNSLAWVMISAGAGLLALLAVAGLYALIRYVQFMHEATP